MKTADSKVILDNAHPIMGVASSKLVGVVNKKGRGRKFFARKQSSTPLYRILDTPLSLATGFGPINLPTHGQLQRGRDHSPTRSPVACSLVHFDFLDSPYYHVISSFYVSRVLACSKLLDVIIGSFIILFVSGYTQSLGRFN